MDLDRAARVSASMAGHVRSAAAEASEWEADIVAFPGALEDDPAARLAMLLVVAGGLVVHHDVLNRPSPEPEAMAELLERSLAATGEKVGSLPEQVLVRDPEVAAALTGRLAENQGFERPETGRPPEVEVSDYLVDLDEAGYSFSRQSTGRPGRYYLASPDTWAGWDLPEALVARIFQAAAGFYRAAPWKVMANLDVLQAVMPAGHTWTVGVMGYAGQELGLNLYSRVTDFWAMSFVDDPETAFDDLAGRIISLSLDDGRETPRAMRREVAAAGWEVADPRAYPRILAINTPAGGVRRRDAEDLVALLAAVPRFVAEHAAAVDELKTVVGWRDEETEIELSYRPPVREQRDSSPDEDGG